MFFILFSYWWVHRIIIIFLGFFFFHFHFIFIFYFMIHLDFPPFFYIQSSTHTTKLSHLQILLCFFTELHLKKVTPYWVGFLFVRDSHFFTYCCFLIRWNALLKPDDCCIATSVFLFVLSRSKENNFDSPLLKITDIRKVCMNGKNTLILYFVRVGRVSRTVFFKIFKKFCFWFAE